MKHEYVLIGWVNNQYLKSAEFFYSAEPLITTQDIGQAKRMSLNDAVKTIQELKTDFVWYALFLQ
jgi:hypothetical protein